MTQQEEIHGYIESIVYADPHQGFTVARLKEPRKAELTCIVGVLPSVQPGETIRCKGVWKLHTQYGRQFEISSFDLQAPSDLVGIQKYLESGMIKGIGPVYAERIVKAFGLNTLDVIDQTPDRLHEVQGIGKKKVDKIKTCWIEQRSIRDVMIFLRGHGISPAFAQKIFKMYGDQSIEKVSSNPYGLAKEVYGMGFKSADKIAANMGIPKDSAVRIDAGIEHVLWELSNQGHVCYPLKDFLPVAKEILEVEVGAIEARVHAQVKAGQLIHEGEMIWVKPLYLCEIGIAREFSRLMGGTSYLRTVDVDKALAWAQEQLKIELAEEQKKAVGLGIQSKLLIITGGPGTGKSTITKAILRITEKLTQEIILAAPTGRAAKRMTEITGKKASTIHSLLEMDFGSGGFKKNKENPLTCSLIIIDEASMIDTQLMYNLLKAIPSTARVILIGDVDQLPSVGPGNVLRDSIESERLPVVQLTQIFRQAAGSQIVVNAHKVNKGEFPDVQRKEGSDFIFIKKEEPEAILDTILELIASRLPKSFRFHKFHDIQVLAPMKRGVIGTDNMNAVLQQKLNPSPTPLIRMGRCFHLGDKVMQIRNNYQKVVFNGDVGKIIDLDMEEETLKVMFDDKAVEYDFSEIDELVLAYAVSIHKYQGSECPCVIIPIHTSHFKLLYRNLLYTGITRGKKLVILIGTGKALAICVSNEEVKKRHTGLKNAVREFIQ
jgi:exodeoxyribonuclease V alpha subunit